MAIGDALDLLKGGMPWATDAEDDLAKAGEIKGRAGYILAGTPRRWRKVNLGTARHMQEHHRAKAAGDLGAWDYDLHTDASAAWWRLVNGHSEDTPDSQSIDLDHGLLKEALHASHFADGHSTFHADLRPRDGHHAEMTRHAHRRRTAGPVNEYDAHEAAEAAHRVAGEAHDEADSWARRGGSYAGIATARAEAASRRAAQASHDAWEVTKRNEAEKRSRQKIRKVNPYTVLRQHGEETLRIRLGELSNAELRDFAAHWGTGLPGRAAHPRATGRDLIDGIVAATQHATNIAPRSPPSRRRGR